METGLARSGEISLDSGTSFHVSMIIIPMKEFIFDKIEKDFRSLTHFKFLKIP